MKYKRQFIEEERLNPFFEALSKQDFTEDYIKWLENKYEQAKQLTLFDVVKSLKDKKTIPFEDWLKQFKESENNTYFVGNGLLYSVDVMKQIYNELPY